MQNQQKYSGEAIKSEKNVISEAEKGLSSQQTRAGGTNAFIWREEYQTEHF